MASAWGSSWNDAWGDSWGILGSITVVVPASTSWGPASKPKDDEVDYALLRLQKVLKDDDEIATVMAQVLKWLL